MNTVQSIFPLLQLPDHCLVAVLRCCAVDPRSVCSAARAHSRLHQAAVEALSSIKHTVRPYLRLHSLMGYLSAYGQHVDSISLVGEGNTITLRQLPAALTNHSSLGAGNVVSLRRLPPTLTKLTSLELSYLDLQLQPGGGHQGVLGAAAAPPLKQLRLEGCTLLDGERGLAAALALLPGLEQLSITDSDADWATLSIPLGDVLPGLQQLTYLELEQVGLSDPVGEPTAGLQHLSALTRLADLRLTPTNGYSITASMLSGSQHLTRLQLAGYEGFWFETAALAGKTLLQHLELQNGQLLGGATGAGQLLSQLQQLQQLTCLRLAGSIRPDGSNPPAAAYSALTASSKLQSLYVTRCTLPVGVWQHVFPAGRQLPHLQELAIARAQHPGSRPAAAPEGSRLVSCCPGLQELDMQGLQYSRGLLDSLQGLSSLQGLYLQPAAGSTRGWVEGLCPLTGLRRLEVRQLHSAPEGLLLQLTQLRQLTHLFYEGPWGCDWTVFQSKASRGEPVWRQVLQRHLKHSDRQVAQQAAAALAE